MPTQTSLVPGRREIIDEDERDRLRAAGALATDTRRSLPAYFNGRFLSAGDLTDDQRYVLSRQADLGRAVGWGVVEGLGVTAGSAATQVVIAPGLAITPSGEVVILPEPVTVDLLSLRNAELLDAHLGLRRNREAVSRVRTGPFVLCLRPVQYTAHPRRGYPTSIQGQREAEDHDIIEATAVTIVPWPTSYAGGPEETRRQLAREIFVLQSGKGLRADLVPIAVVFLDGVGVRFIDTHLVRRSIGAEQDDLLGLNTVPRAVRAAFVQQYSEHLRDVLAQTGGRQIHALEFFDVLPPVGQLPLQSIHRTDFTEAFFPPTLDVDLSIVPADELPLLIEESLMLPPIDLGADEATLAGVSVLVLLPLSRASFRSFKASLTSVQRTPLPRSTRFARPEPLPLLTRPVLSAGNLRLPGSLSVISRDELSQAALVTAQESALWTSAYDEAAASGTLLWFVRRPNFDYRADFLNALVDIDVVGGV